MRTQTIFLLRKMIYSNLPVHDDKMVGLNKTINRHIENEIKEIHNLSSFDQEIGTSYEHITDQIGLHLNRVKKLQKASALNYALEIVQKHG